MKKKHVTGKLPIFLRYEFESVYLKPALKWNKINDNEEDNVGAFEIFLPSGHQFKVTSHIFV